MKYLIVSAILFMAASMAQADVLYVDTAVSDDNLVHMTVFKPANSGEKGAVYIDRGYYGIEEARIPMGYNGVVKMRDAFTRAAKKMENHAK